MKVIHPKGMVRVRCYTSANSCQSAGVAALYLRALSATTWSHLCANNCKTNQVLGKTKQDIFTNRKEAGVTEVTSDLLFNHSYSPISKYYIKATHVPRYTFQDTSSLCSNPEAGISKQSTRPKMASSCSLWSKQCPNGISSPLQT